MKIIFLDIDGVLNSNDFFRSGDRRLRDNDDGSTRGPADMFDPVAIARLNSIIDRTGALVVISSSWRLAYATHLIWAYMEGQGFNGKIIGSTPIIMPRKLSQHVTRGEEIQAWLGWVGAAVESYVVLDDCGRLEMRKVARNYVETTWEHGLRDEHVDRAVQLLNGSA